MIGPGCKRASQETSGGLPGSVCDGGVVQSVLRIKVEIGEGEESLALVQ